MASLIFLNWTVNTDAFPIGNVVLDPVPDVSKGVGVAAGELRQLRTEGHNRLGMLTSRAGD